MVLMLPDMLVHKIVFWTEGRMDFEMVSGMVHKMEH